MSKRIRLLLLVLVMLLSAFSHPLVAQAQWQDDAPDRPNEVTEDNNYGSWRQNWLLLPQAEKTERTRSLWPFFLFCLGWIGLFLGWWVLGRFMWRRQQRQ